MTKAALEKLGDSEVLAAEVYNKPAARIQVRQVLSPDGHCMNQSRYPIVFPFDLLSIDAVRRFRSKPLAAYQEQLVKHKPFSGPGNNFLMNIVRRFPWVFLRLVQAQSAISVHVNACGWGNVRFLDHDFRHSAHYQRGGQFATFSNTSITDTPTARDLPNADDYQAATIAFLKGQQELYKSGIAAIDDYLAKIQKGKVNKGSTEPQRTVNSNAISSKPGPRTDLLQVDPKEHLEYLKAERRRAEEALALEKQIKQERELAFNARVELLKFTQGKG